MQLDYMCKDGQSKDEGERTYDNMRQIREQFVVEFSIVERLLRRHLPRYRSVTAHMKRILLMGYPYDRFCLVRERSARGTQGRISIMDFYHKVRWSTIKLVSKHPRKNVTDEMITVVPAVE